MSFSLLLLQNESISPDMLSLFAKKIPNANVDRRSVSAAPHSSLNVANYDLVITKDKFIKRSINKNEVEVIVWKELSDLSAKIEVYLQLSRYLAQYPLRLKNWTLTEVLHDSDDALIFRAEDAKGQQIAIKRFKFKPSYLSDMMVHEFLSHIEKQCSLRSSGLVRFIDGGVCDEAFYLIMEYMEHGTLRQSLNSCGDVLPQTHALTWFHEIVVALDVIHRAGLIHRDLKIENIMLRSDGSLALMDYGVSKRILLDAGFVIESELHCSPHYVSPEQISGDACTKASDVYSLGVIFYELLTGHKPYSAKEPYELMMHHVMAPVPVLPNHLKQFQFILDKMMAKDPADRFTNIIDAIEELPLAM